MTDFVTPHVYVLRQITNQPGGIMDNGHENRLSRVESEACSAAVAASPKSAGSPPMGARAVLRLVHSTPQPNGVSIARGVRAFPSLVGKHQRERSSESTEAASAGRYPQRIDLYRTGKSWAWAAAPYTAQKIGCEEAFDYRIWRRAGAQPVLIAALASGTDTALQGGVGAALAASALVNIIDEEMTAHLETDRLAALLHGAAGEVQLMLELQAEENNRPVRDYATELLAVILTGTGGVIGQIGGGSALFQEEDEAWRPVSWFRHGGRTHKAQCLTEAGAFSAFRIAEIPSAAHRVSLFSGALRQVFAELRV